MAINDSSDSGKNGGDQPIAGLAAEGELEFGPKAKLNYKICRSPQRDRHAVIVGPLNEWLRRQGLRFSLASVESKRSAWPL